MEAEKNNSRRDLLKKIPWAIAVVIGLGAFVFPKGKKKSLPVEEEKDYPSPDVKLLSKQEADELIRNSAAQGISQYKPKPAPVEKV